MYLKLSSWCEYK